MKRIICVCLLLALVTTTSGCATYQAQQDSPLEGEPNPARTRTEFETKSGTVKTIVDRARDEFHEGKLDASEETINRGLNIAPENPVLWHLLAKMRFLNSNYDEAETLASRSISYTGNNRGLTNQNWRLIGYARKKRGDEPGARKALDRIRTDEEPGGWFGWF